MSYVVLLGEGALSSFSPGTTVIPIDSSSFGSNVTVETANNRFRVSDLDNYTLQTDLYIRGLVGAQRYTIELYNQSTDVVVDSFTTTTIGLGQIFESATFMFRLTVSNAAHNYQLRITIPQDAPTGSITLGVPNFVATLTIANPGGGGTEWKNVTLGSGTRTLLQTDHLTVFDNLGSGGASNIDFPDTISAPMLFRLVLTDTEEMRVTSTSAGVPRTMYLEALGAAVSSFLRNNGNIIGTALEVQLVGTGGSEVIFTTQLGGVWRGT